MSVTHHQQDLVKLLLLATPILIHRLQEEEILFSLGYKLLLPLLEIKYLIKRTIRTQQAPSYIVLAMWEISS